MADMFEDDGSLACLRIPADRANKRFQCPEEQQTNLLNKTFWVLDFFPDVETRFGTRHLFKMKYNLEDAETEARKDNWQIFPVDDRGLDFLGYVFRHRGIRLRKRIKQNIFRAVRAIRFRHDLDMKAKRQAVASYIGWLKYTDSTNLKHTLNTFAYAQLF